MFFTEPNRDVFPLVCWSLCFTIYMGARIDLVECELVLFLKTHPGLVCNWICWLQLRCWKSEKPRNRFKKPLKNPVCTFILVDTSQTCLQFIFLHKREHKRELYNTKSAPVCTVSCRVILPLGCLPYISSFRKTSSKNNYFGPLFPTQQHKKYIHSCTSSNFFYKLR